MDNLNSTTDRRLLVARELSAGYGKEPVLQNINLTIREGEFIGIAGPNGSGKTTLIRALTGVIHHHQGTLRWQGDKPDDDSHSSFSRHLAVVPQIRGEHIDLPVEDLIMLGRIPYFRKFQWWPGKEDREVVEWTLEATETTGFRRKNFRNLSGGEQQRVMIATALAQEPELLMLDEPTLHLDINFQVEIFRLLRRLNRDRGLTVFTVLHDLNMASAYCHRLIYLQEGRIWKDGPIEEMISPEYLSELFRVRVEVMRHPRTDRPILIPEM
ncbi:MAG: ABC transporter ATP-binding protein [Candidatus Auribacterota bacterium]|nr:ABC transporter ATP-binding protein [Candidatus Auribacterota bacterium]